MKNNLRKNFYYFTQNTLKMKKKNLKDFSKKMISQIYIFLRGVNFVIKPVHIFA